MRQTHFVTSKEIPELLDQSRWAEIKKTKQFKVWLVYNKGRSLAYVWNSEILSEIEARKKAYLELVVIGE